MEPSVDAIVVYHYLHNLENSLQLLFGNVFESSYLHHTNLNNKIIMEPRLIEKINDDERLRPSNSTYTLLHAFSPV